MNKDWHSSHFCCWQCDESLTGQRYVLREEHPYCIRCYESVFANTCDECQQLIGIDSKVRDRILFSYYTFLSDTIYYGFCFLGSVVQGEALAWVLWTCFLIELKLKWKIGKNADEACFLCSKCRVSLVDKQFGSKVFCYFNRFYIEMGILKLWLHRPRRSTAATATTPNSPPGAMDVAKFSEPVSLFLFILWVVV